MKPKVFKSEAEYEAALAYAYTLMDAEPGSQEEEDLDLFTMLIEQYEQEHYPIAPPDPVDAILFRMDQEGLTRKDLVAYIGSQSKVSEVLNRKRPLSLSMIRNLHEGLGIPADVLLQQPGRDLARIAHDYRRYPFAELLKRGYFPDWDGGLQRAKEYAEELLNNLFAPLGEFIPQAVYCRRTRDEIDSFALAAWQARVLFLAQEHDLPPYDPHALNETFFRKVVRASYFSTGPGLVPDLLYEAGISFVVLHHLPKTYLDGACFLSPAGRPVIGMTLRYDRLDNFWFTLAHELAHVRLHLHDRSVAFFDDIDHAPCGDDDPREVEANAFARNILIPDQVWRTEGRALMEAGQERDVIAFAQRNEISPAIVAGRLRWEKNDFTIYSDLVGNRMVRGLLSTAEHQAE